MREKKWSKLYFEKGIERKREKGSKSFVPCFHFPYLRCAICCGPCARTDQSFHDKMKRRMRVNGEKKSTKKENVERS